jgi:cob(I)alamin adenosyltransferase
MNTKGLVYVFTGEGKGKTSAALGVVVRALSHGMKVGWVSWYKQQIPSARFFKKRVKMYALGKGFYRLPGDQASLKAHRQAAARALEQANSLINQVEVLVLDEVNNAVKDKLIDLIGLIDLISKRGKTHLILTGRGADKEVIKLADLVTEMKKIKHPFDSGKKAVPGLDL